MGARARRPLRVLYVSGLMRRETLQRLFSDAPFPPSQAAQKYHGLLTRGLAENGAEVIAVSAPPVSRRTSKRRFVCLPPETADGVQYRYLPVWDIPGIKQAITWCSSFFTTLFRLHGNAYVLCDGLTIMAGSGALAAAKLRRRPCTAIVTDVPEILGGGSRTAKLNTRVLARYDGYLLLTAAMSERVNPKGKPYLVAEGQVDADMHLRHNIQAQKHAEKVCLYAGMLHEQYGILRLVEAFERVKDPEIRLDIYGTGDSVEAIQAAQQRDARIRYRGVVDNARVVEEEMHATLLINPRPTDAEFTRYSFPSKNLEYMASATPVLTTRLPGMPQEYNDYVYLFDGETPEQMAKTLESVLALPRETLHEKGLAAKAFVLAGKSNCAVAKRVLQFMEGLS